MPRIEVAFAHRQPQKTYGNAERKLGDPRKDPVSGGDPAHQHQTGLEQILETNSKDKLHGRKGRELYLTQPRPRSEAAAAPPPPRGDLFFGDKIKF